MNYPPHIAIVTLNWNGLQDTLECLESVFKNNYPNYSVYVVDNASKKNELSKIKQFCKTKIPLFFIQNKKNEGFSEGNNVAIRKALENGADYIFTLNNDTTVDQNFLTSAIEFLHHSKFKIHDSDPTGILAPSMINYYDRTKFDNTGHDLLTTGDTVPRNRNKRLQVTHDTSPAPMGSCAGASLYSAAMLKQIGLFDPDYFLNYEDSDLSLRAIVQGWKCAYCPGSIVYHKISRSIGKIKNTEYRIRSQRNQLWAYLHNVPAPVLFLNLPWILLRDLLILIVGILTFHWTIVKIVICSRFEVLKTLLLIWKKRRKVQAHRKISSLQFWRQQKSWIPTYWQYFKDIVIHRKNSVME